MSSIPETDATGVDVLPAASETPPGTQRAHPSPWLVLRVWLGLGLQSFGGGTATLFLIRRAVVERHGWISDAEFTRDWSLCLIAPGINLLCMTILIGRRVAGAVGVVLALVGLLLPSVTLTVLITALFATIQRLAIVQAALRGVVPATVGLGLLLAFGMAQPPLAASRREGRFSLLLSCALLLCSGLAAALWHPPVVAVLCGAGLAGAIALWRRGTPAEERQP